MSDDTFAVRCFINDQRRFTDELSRPEAEVFHQTATHLAGYLAGEYGLHGTHVLVEKGKLERAALVVLLNEQRPGLGREGIADAILAHLKGTD